MCEQKDRKAVHGGCLGERERYAAEMLVAIIQLIKSCITAKLIKSNIFFLAHGVT